MTGTINTAAPITKNQQAVIDKFGFDVSTDKNGVWTVKDAALRRKHQFKDASKGKYVGKTLDEALKLAVADHEQESTPKTDSTNGDTASGDDNKTKRQKQRAEKAAGERKENRYLRASKIIAEDLAITADGLASKAAMSGSTAGHCLEAWRGVVAVLLRNGALTKEWQTKLSATATSIIQPKTAKAEPEPKANKKPAKK